MKQLTTTVAVAVFLAVSAARAESTMVVMNAIDATGVKNPIGTVRLEDGDKGLQLHVVLNALPPGQHGFHAHETGDCNAKEKDGKPGAGLAAGGHYDPAKTGKHEGPGGKGHAGDLPVLTADDKGNINTETVVPRLKVADLRGRSLMIHAGGDNYSDWTKPLGGGGDRIACGVVK